MSIHVMLVFFCHLILHFQENSKLCKGNRQYPKKNNAPHLSQAFSNKDQRIHAVSHTRITCI